MHKISFCEIWGFLKSVFSGSNKNLFFGVISYNLLHLYPWKLWKRMQYAWQYSDWYKVFVHWKSKLLNFLMNYELSFKFCWSICCFDLSIDNGAIFIHVNEQRRNALICFKLLFFDIVYINAFTFLVNRVYW